MLELIDGRASALPVHIPRPRAPRGRDDVESIVADIIGEVRLNGDTAVAGFTARFDGADVPPESIQIDPAEIDKARGLVRPELIQALEVMRERLRTTCERQVATGWIDREHGDSWVGELVRPMRRVGIYVPGGRAVYPSTVVMAAVPAQVAGVESLAVATPPGPGGDVAEAVLAACSVVGIDEVYRMGGAQAIAALAYGTDRVRPVDKIVGPGNVYVTTAKRMVAGWVGTDTDAGPTEVMIVADDSLAPEIAAADLVAQAEHGPLGTHVLVTWQSEFAERVIAALDIEVARHERSEDVENALTEGGYAVLVTDPDHAIATANAFAPEHLELCFDGAENVLDAIQHAGSVFVGPFSPVPLGDYVGGTNHILPAGGSARYSSGLGVADYYRRIYVSGFERSALERLAPHVEALAEAEGLPAHALTITKRLGS